MQTFKWEDRTYTFDVMECYRGNGHIQLPDGRLLKVGGWCEVFPPIPTNLQLVTPKSKPWMTGTPATEVSQ